MSAPTALEHRFRAAPDLDHRGPDEVTGLWLLPRAPSHALVLGHGAGSTCRHPLMEELALALHGQNIATFRFNYPYSERGGGMSSLPLRLATVRSAAREARALSGDLPLFVGGHSMSGRMFSTAMASDPLPGVRGVVLYAFPLHSGPPDAKRAAHLDDLRCPSLFVSGDRDKMAELGLLSSVVAGLPQATLRIIDTADHGFRTLKRRRVQRSAWDEMACETRSWMDAL